MNANKMICLPIGGTRCISVANVQAAKPMPARNPVISFGKMECRSIGDRRMVLVGRIGGVEPPKQ